MERINRDDYIALACSLLGKGEAVVLTGHRRAGKSCILELLAQKLTAEGNVIYIDMENPENADLASFRELSERIIFQNKSSFYYFVLYNYDKSIFLRCQEKTARRPSLKSFCHNVAA